MGLIDGDPDGWMLLLGFILGSSLGCEDKDEESKASQMGPY